MSALADIVARSWRADRGRFIAGIIVSAVTILAGIALLGVAGWFIAASSLAGVAGIGLSFKFFQPSAAIRFLAIVRTGSRYAERLVTHDATLRFLSVLRVDLFRGLATLKAGTLSRWRGAEMLQRLTSDVDALDNLYLRLVVPAVVLATVAGAMIFTLSQISWSAAAVTALLLLGSLAISIGAGAWTRNDARRRAAAQEALRVRTVDLVRAQIDLAVAGRLAAQKQSAFNAACRMTAAARRLNVADSVTGAILSLLGSAALLAVFLVAAIELKAGRMEGPVLVLVLLAMLAATEAVVPLRRGALEFGRTLLAARRVAPLLATQNAPLPPASVPRTARPAAPPALQLDEISFLYAPGRSPVLTGLSLTLAPGEPLALVGASGSGKSTLLAMIAGLVEPTSGCIRMNGRQLSDIPSADRLACIALLTQRTELFRDSIAENLRVAAPDATDEQIWDALAAVELDARVRGLPDALQARLGEGGAGLSGGEARRLALARIVLKSPPIWLLDEPTAGLDEGLAARVMGNLVRRAGDATVIIASHNDREAAIAGRVVRLDMSVSAKDATPQ